MARDEYTELTKTLATLTDYNIPYDDINEPRERNIVIKRIKNELGGGSGSGDLQSVLHNGNTVTDNTEAVWSQGAGTRGISTHIATNGYSQTGFDTSADVTREVRYNLSSIKVADYISGVEQGQSNLDLETNITLKRDANGKSNQLLGTTFANTIHTIAEIAVYYTDNQELNCRYGNVTDTSVSKFVYAIPGRASNDQGQFMLTSDDDTNIAFRARNTSGVPDADYNFELDTFEYSNDAGATWTVSPLPWDLEGTGSRSFTASGFRMDTNASYFVASGEAEQEEIGSEDIVLNLNGLDKRPTYETTTGKEQLALLSDAQDFPDYPEGAGIICANGGSVGFTATNDGFWQVVIDPINVDDVAWYRVVDYTRGNIIAQDNWKQATTNAGKMSSYIPARKGQQVELSWQDETTGPGTLPNGAELWFIPLTGRVA